MKLVLAYGNPLRGDDGVGWRVASALGPASDVVVEYVQQLGPELAWAIARAEGVLFLDAAVDGEPGDVRVHDVVSAAGDGGLGHVMPPAALLDLVRRLQGNVPPAVIVTVTAGSLGFGDALSREVEAALPAATGAARAALARLRARPTAPRAGPAESQP